MGAKSATSGKAGGLAEVERLKAARPCGRWFMRLFQNHLTSFTIQADSPLRLRRRSPTLTRTAVNSTLLLPVFIQTQFTPNLFRSESRKRQTLRVLRHSRRISYGLKNGIPV